MKRHSSSGHAITRDQYLLAAPRLQLGNPFSELWGVRLWSDRGVAAGGLVDGSRVTTIDVDAVTAEMT